MTISPLHGTALAFLALLIVSCTKQESALPAAPRSTSPATGQVLVDGQPAPKLLVTCHDNRGTDIPNAPRPVGLTGEDGKIEFSTWQKADGIPAGEYVLTFTWREWDPYWNRFHGTDRLKDRYADPATSTVKLSVKKDAPTELGTIELSTE